MNMPSGMESTSASRSVSHRPPHPEALELAADLLLAFAGRDDEYPAYSEEHLARRNKRLSRLTARSSRPYTCTDRLLAAEVDDLCTAAGLEGDELSAWTLHLDGYLPEEIGEMLGTTRTRAVRLINSARNRLASSASPSRGLYSAYLSLIHRHIYRPPFTIPGTQA